MYILVYYYYIYLNNLIKCKLILSPVVFMYRIYNIFFIRFYFSLSTLFLFNYIEILSNPVTICQTYLNISRYLSSHCYTCEYFFKTYNNSQIATASVFNNNNNNYLLLYYIISYALLSL